CRMFTLRPNARVQLRRNQIRARAKPAPSMVPSSAATNVGRPASQWQSRGFSIHGLCDRARLKRRHVEARKVILGQTKEEVVIVQVPDHESRSSPMNTLGLDAVRREVFA